MRKQKPTANFKSCERLRPLLHRLTLADNEQRRYDKELKKVIG